MKKVFGIVAALAFTASLMAANTANFVIAVESPDNDNIYDELVMAESMEYTAAYENLRDAEKMADANNPSLYGYVENRKCGVIATNNLEGMVLTLETVGETNYDISFYNVGGATYYFIDLVGGTYVQIAESNSNVMHLTGVTANSTLADRFMISQMPVVAVTSVTTNDYGWASFSYDQDLVPVNATAQTLYKGAINGEYLDLTSVDYVPNGQGVLVKGEANTTYYFAAGSGNDVFNDNDLKATATYSTSMQNVYVLKGNAFLEYVGSTPLAASKAYIQLPSAGPNNAPRRISFRFNGTTALENAEMNEAKAVKFVENGQVFIRRGNEVFNLQGQIVK